MIFAARQPGWTDMEYHMRNWYYFTWLSGDFNVEQRVHMLDVMTRSAGHNANLESAHRRAANPPRGSSGQRVVWVFLLPSEIEEWTDELAGVSTTALCPRCGIDSVIGSRSGFALTSEFLREMHDYWFT
jgi:hypothetical protein